MNSNFINSVNRKISSLLDDKNQNGRVTEAEKTAELIKAFYDSNQKSHSAVIGYDLENNEVLWDMGAGNLIMSGKTGSSVNYIGADLILTHLNIKYTSEDFGYYILTDEESNGFLNKNGNCLGEYHYFSNKIYSPRLLINKINNEVNRRFNLNANDLEKEPFLLVVLGNPEKFIDAFSDRSELRKMLFNILKKAQKCKMACIYMTTRYGISFCDEAPIGNELSEYFNYRLLVGANTEIINLLTENKYFKAFDSTLKKGEGMICLYEEYGKERSVLRSCYHNLHLTLCEDRKNEF